MEDKILQGEFHHHCWHELCNMETCRALSPMKLSVDGMILSSLFGVTSGNVLRR